MNRKQLLLPILILFLSSLVFAEQEITDELFYSDKYILILKSTKNYNEAVNFATKASKELGLEFKNEHIKYSEEKGIYFSEDIDDRLYRDGYYPRRYGGEYISLENSLAYEGFDEGYIIVVGGVYNDKERVDRALGKAREIYKDAYAKKTNMWMGCIH